MNESKSYFNDKYSRDVILKQYIKYIQELDEETISEFEDKNIDEVRGFLIDQGLWNTNDFEDTIIDIQNKEINLKEMFDDCNVSYVFCNYDLNDSISIFSSDCKLDALNVDKNVILEKYNDLLIKSKQYDYVQINFI